MKRITATFMGLLYCAAGINHFVNPANFVKIMPPYIPWHLPLVYVSGAAEFFLGALLCIPRFRVLAAWGIIALLIAVFPANIYMYQQGGAAFDFPDWALLVRLPIQGLLIAWAYWYTRPNTHDTHHV